MAAKIRIPYVNLANQHRAIKHELLGAIEAVLDSGQFILSEVVGQFEHEFARLCGVRHAIAVNSGTDAIFLALRALNIGQGDEVISVPNSFIATASAIALTGATPVFVDVGADYNMDPAALEQAITPRTKAILPVHLTGRCADMEGILAVAERHGLAVVEDAAQAVMAECRGKRSGSLGTLGCFSLHPLKTLNACGDGGVVTTDDAALADRLKILRNIGLRTRDDCREWSGNSRLDSIQAAILLVKMRYLPTWTDKRRANAQFYRQAMSNIPGVLLPHEGSWERPVYHTFVILAEDRDNLKRHLLECGIETSIHYPIPIHLHSAASSLRLPVGSFPVAERQARMILSLPVYPELSNEDLQFVADSIRQFYS